MKQDKEIPSHNLIPEKVPTFSCDDHTYFSDFLKQIATKLDVSVYEIKYWEDETVLIMLEKESVFLSALDKQKLLAYKNYDEEKAEMLTPLEFSNLASIINNEVPITDSLDTIDPAHVAWAIEILERYSKQTDEDSPLISITDEIASYVAMCFYEEGFSYMPKSLDIFQEYLQKIIAVSPIEDNDDKIKRVEDYLEVMREKAASIS